MVGRMYFVNSLGVKVGCVTQRILHHHFAVRPLVAAFAIAKEKLPQTLVLSNKNRLAGLFGDIVQLVGVLFEIIKLHKSL